MQIYGYMMDDTMMYYGFDAEGRAQYVEIALDDFEGVEQEAMDAARDVLVESIDGY